MKWLKNKYIWATLVIAVGIIAMYNINLQEETTLGAVPPSFVFNGTTINLPYTDDNVGEDILIYGQSENIGGYDTAEYIFAVTNFLYNELPMRSYAISPWGSYEAVEKWLKQGDRQKDSENVEHSKS